jgi:hypothetical protein
MIHIKTDEIYGKNPITNPNDYRTRILHVDSRARDTLLEPSTDFHYRLARPLKNILKLRVASIELPNAYFTFTPSQQNTMFRLDATDYQGNPHFLTIEIPEGDYTPTTLHQAIQHQFDAIKDTYGLFFRITLDPHTNRTTITLDGSAPPPTPLAPTHHPTTFGLTFLMVGQEDRKTDFGLGHHLGYLKPFYVVDPQPNQPTAITSEAPTLTDPPPAFFLQVNDYDTVEQKTQTTAFQALAKLVLHRTPHHTLQSHTLLSNEITFPRPQDLKTLHVRLVDPQGTPVDLHHRDFSFSLETTEVMNLQLYESYRNYLWATPNQQTTLQKDQSLGPRPVTHLSGSAAPIAPPAMNYP